MLELKNISFSAKTDRGNAEILKHVSLTIPDGKFLVITGPNGGGKSTLAKIIMGIEQPTEGSIFLDGEKHMVYVKDEPVDLTFKEYELLKLLIQNQGIVMSRDVIMERIWGIDFEGESRTLDVHIKTLRQKLKNAGTLIKTVRNVGYMIE